MTQEILIWIAAGIILAVSVFFGIGYILAMTETVALNHPLLRPINWVVDIIYKLDDKLVSLTFDRGKSRERK